MNSSLSAKNTLILGIGNILKKDDGAGVHIINRLARECPELAESADMIDGGTAGFDLIEYMIGRRRIIVIDALLHDAPAGSIFHFSAEHLASGGRLFSQHQIGLSKIIEMMKIMGHDPVIEIIGIVPGDISSDEIGLTREVESSVAGVSLLIKETVSNLIDGGL